MNAYTDILTRTILVLSMMVISLESIAAKTYCSDDTIIHTDIFYEQGSSIYNPTMRENASSIQKLLATIGAGRVMEIDVVSSASPEGNTDLNYTLSNQRNLTALELIKNLTGFENAHLNVKALGTDWSGLADLIEQSNMQFASEAANLVRNTPEWIKKDSIVVDGRKLRLRLLRDNHPWQFMVENIFPDLRVSHISIRYKNEIARIQTPITMAVEGKPSLYQCNIDSIILGNLSNAVIENKKTIVASVRTNLLYDLAAIPNLGIEFMLPKGWSMGIGGMYAWWNKANMEKVWRIQSAEILLKKYLKNTPPILQTAGI